MDAKVNCVFLPGVLDIQSVDIVRLLLLVLPTTILLHLITNEIRRYKARLPDIDGPSGLPVIGNLHQLGPDPAERLRQWGLKYGGVYQIMMGNMPVVVFSSMRAARDVFIGQGGALVDRPRFYTFHGVLSSVASTIGTTPWSESTKKRRKAAATAMNKSSTTSYIPLIDELSRDFISDLLQTGKSGNIAFDPKPFIQATILDLTMTLNYGARLPKEPELFDELTYVEENVSRIRSAVGSLQDYIPILRWNPVNSKSAHAMEINRRRLRYLNRFNDELQHRLKEDKSKPCIQGNVLKNPESNFTDVELMSISMSMVSGGLDTMVNTMSWTVGTLARHPEIQETAYQAIRNVYGTETWGDIKQENGVPYITALVKECLRYFSVLRLSLPRTAWRDIEYKGIHIPKGTTVFLNAWGCNRDDAAFGPDAHEFHPERFLESEAGTYLDHAAFGLGTRMCAGNQLAQRQLYIMILRIIWAFKIELSSNPLENKWNIDPLEDSTEPFHFAAIPPRYKLRFVPRDYKLLQQMLQVNGLVSV
ncbi:cytochrome P450 [Xylogone sp. PMI_703]|nr:cytochrome P450 [Xylogone sp. PMI_703]